MKLSILFLLRRSRINEKGLCPIECRITLDKERKPFSTGLFVSQKIKHTAISYENIFLLISAISSLIAS
ncbi:Arm DNA-binding domain-containing protein [Elizabethkingia anophelis]|uniref:Arm DNA-binding domain-containing protein n=1 Tax=Elizabethkingia anophelis TaxID=1117645 RepID=UPI001C884762|nr:hypothetical protein [Elizabethkingia anophelis]